jgi:hypothetical protein
MVRNMCDTRLCYSEQRYGAEIVKYNLCKLKEYGENTNETAITMYNISARTAGSDMANHTKKTITNL